jgi:hypothetical protein
MCAQKRKTWEEKLNINREPVIEKAEKDFAGVHAGQSMLIPTPKLIDAYIRAIPRGRSVDAATIRRDLAAAYHADVTCPLTTGIFIRIAAEAAWEQYEKGAPLSRITPFWRVIDEGSPAAKKLSFGTGLLKAQRQKEKLDRKNN